MLFFSPVGGKIFDHYGPKVPILIGSIMHVFGLMMLSISSKYYQILLSQSICSGVGSSLVFSPALTAVGYPCCSSSPHSDVSSIGTNLLRQEERNSTRTCRRWFVGRGCHLSPNGTAPYSKGGIWLGYPHLRLSHPGYASFVQPDHHLKPYALAQAL